MIKGAVGGDDEGSRPSVRPPVRTTIDEVSKRIVELLQVDGRRSFASIGRELHIDDDAVEQRVQALVDSGTVTFTTVADPLRLGFTRQAMLGVRVDRGLDEGVAERLARIPQVAYLVLTAGGFDLMAEVVATSDDHLRHIVEELVRPVAGVREVHTFLFEGVEKETYSWGVL